MLSLCILPSAENALVMSLIFLIWKLNLQTKLWNNSLCRIDHHPFFNNKSVLCPHLQLISFVLQHSGNLFSRPQPTDGFFPGACLSTFCPRTKPIPVHKHVQALMCLAYPKAMYHLDPLLSFGWLSTFPLPWSWSHRCCSGLTKVGSCGPPLPDCFPGVLQGLNFSFCLWCILWEVFHPLRVVFSLLSACICSDVSALLLKNSNFLIISVWASFVFHLKQAQWVTLVKILAACQYLFLQKMVSSSCLWQCLKSYCTLVISHFDLLCISWAFPGIPSI